MKKTLENALIRYKLVFVKFVKKQRVTFFFTVGHPHK